MAEAIQKACGPRGLTSRRLALADSLKVLTSKCFGFNEGLSRKESIEIANIYKDRGMIELGDEDVRHLELTMRRYMQNLGQGAREVFGDDFWLDQVLPAGRSELMVKYGDLDVLVVPDIRMPNEAQRVHEINRQWQPQFKAQLWNVTRPGVDSDGHVTEQGLDKSLVDVHINNSHSLNILEITVAQLLAEVID